MSGMMRQLSVWLRSAHAARPRPPPVSRVSCLRCGITYIVNNKMPACWLTVPLHMRRHRRRHMRLMRQRSRDSLDRTVSQRVLPPRPYAPPTSSVVHFSRHVHVSRLRSGSWQASDRTDPAHNLLLSVAHGAIAVVGQQACLAQHHADVLSCGLGP